MKNQIVGLLVQPGCSINSRTFSSVTDGSLGDALGDALAAALGGAIDCCIQDGVGLD